MEADPDVVLLPGDFLYGPSEEIDAQVGTVLELLAPLTDSGIPTVAVLGNHDYQAGAAEQLAAALEGSGIQVLRNQAMTLPVGGPGQPLHVVGIGPEGIGLTDPQRAFAGVPADAPRSC